MVAINELRIDNLVSTNGKPFDTQNKAFYRIKEIASNVMTDRPSVMITADGINANYVGSVYVNDLEPIPLTTKLLEKCRFEYDPVIFQYQYDDIGVLIDDKKLGITTDAFGDSLIICHYLHQLQNMYYAITGKELEVKL